MIVCDYVRADAGVIHIVGGGIDRVRPQMLPAVFNIGVAIRIKLARVECGIDHAIQLIFQTQDGQRIVDVHGTFRADYPDGLPPGWPAFGALPMLLAIPLTDPGVYSIELMINNNLAKSSGIIVDAPPSGG